jgi:hypothetical protein
VLVVDRGVVVAIDHLGQGAAIVWSQFEARGESLDDLDIPANPNRFPESARRFLEMPFRLVGRHVEQNDEVQLAEVDEARQRAPWFLHLAVKLGDLPPQGASILGHVVTPALLQGVWVDSDLHSKLWEHAGEDLET